MNDRIERLRKQMDKKGLNAVLVTGKTNIRYFSGFTSEDATLVITGDEAFLLTDFRYTIQAKEQTNGRFTLVEVGRGQYVDTIKELLARDNCVCVGFEDAEVSFSTYQLLGGLQVELAPFSEEMNRIRIIKTADEIESLKKAQAIADKAFIELLNTIHPGMSEKRVAAELLYICAKLGSEGPSFDPIVGSGPNGAMCHAVPSERVLQKGDLVVLDFGCIYNGYCSDMTRTIAVGEVDDFSKKIYDIVLEAQLRALNALRAGILGSELDDVARSYIASKGYGDCFGHSLGHGFGLQVHEAPMASTRSTDTFEPGMTITIEPGIYIEGKCGVRIEDCCVVAEDGKINLVSSSKECFSIN
ncbi:MAG: Xaa-Pro peptidase family protein [Clostridia bacterium]|nr:Xaa-Pro peptidase family protein [Clostridia bacterium]